jgi:hypothetical protein
MEDEEDMEDEECREVMDEWEDFETLDNETAMSADIDELIGQSREIPTDWYVREGVDTSQDNGYLGNVEDSSNVMHIDQEVIYSDIPADDVLDNLNAMSTSFQPTNRSARRESTAQSNHNEEVTPYVYLTDDQQSEDAIARTIEQFTLNEEQQHAFCIIAEHTVGKSQVGDQLLMAIFGEGGTGKSRVVEAVRYWFTALNRQHELVVTGLTGAAAFNIRGPTLHSALGIKVEKEDIDRVAKANSSFQLLAI